MPSIYLEQTEDQWSLEDKWGKARGENRRPYKAQKRECKIHTLEIRGQRGRGGGEGDKREPGFMFVSGEKGRVQCRLLAETKGVSEIGVAGEL